MGLRDHGHQFRTAETANYPPDMCRMIANLVLDTWSQTRTPKVERSSPTLTTGRGGESPATDETRSKRPTGVSIAPHVGAAQAANFGRPANASCVQQAGAADPMVEQAANFGKDLARPTSTVSTVGAVLLMVAGTASFESPTGAAGARGVGAAEPRVDEKAANFHLSH
eukprot:9628075-Karenia_brevis.AAC.1